MSSKKKAKTEEKKKLPVVSSYFEIAVREGGLHIVEADKVFVCGSSCRLMLKDRLMMLLAEGSWLYIKKLPKIR